MKIWNIKFRTSLGLGDALRRSSFVFLSLVRFAAYPVRRVYMFHYKFVITVVHTYFARIYIIVTVPCVLPGEIISVEDGPGQQQENSIVKITEIVRFLIRLKTISPLRPYLFR